MRLRTGHGRCGHMMFKWTVQNVIVGMTARLSDILQTNASFESGINGINEVTKEAFEWIRALDIEI